MEQNSQPYDMNLRSYEEDQKVRLENIIWTINQDYKIDPKTQLLAETEIKSLTRYRTMVFAAIHMSNHARELLEYLVRKKQSTQDGAIFTEIMMLTLEESVLGLVSQEFAGIKSIEKQVIEDVVTYYDKHKKRKDAYHEIRYAYYTDKNKKVPKTHKRVMDLLSDIHQFKAIDIIHQGKTYIAKLDELLEKHFHFEKSDDLSSGESESTDEGAGKSKEKSENEQKRDSGQDRLPDDAQSEQIMSAEFSQYDIGNEEKTYAKDQAEAPKEVQLSFDSQIKNKIIASYGKAKIKGKALENLEKTLCTGIHENEKLHITDSFLDVEGYKKTVLEKARDFNMEEYEYRSRIYRRNIVKLKDDLLRTITADMDYSDTKLDNGILSAGTAWRKSILGDDNVFHKNFKDQRGEIVVDILLDASGSQKSRQSMVAAQAFIIAQALTMAKIPCRVSSFNNLFDYTIIKLYRDFNDPESKNKKIFSYTAEGSNRDGLAIATIGKLLQERSEDHKILIILSDGKPNDERVTGPGSLSTSGTRSYIGNTAIEDTAQKVRSLRTKGMAVLGVFTGQYEDLHVEQRVFGRDFAYIKNIERFSDIVGVYLKKQINNMLDSEY